jgi:hypothetical protein
MLLHCKLCRHAPFLNQYLCYQSLWIAVPELRLFPDVTTARKKKLESSKLFSFLLLPFWAPFF